MHTGLTSFRGYFIVQSWGAEGKYSPWKQGSFLRPSPFRVGQTLRPSTTPEAPGVSGLPLHKASPPAFQGIAQPLTGRGRRAGKPTVRAHSMHRLCYTEMPAHDLPGIRCPIKGTLFIPVTPSRRYASARCSSQPSACRSPRPAGRRPRRPACASARSSQLGFRFDRVRRRCSITAAAISPT